MENNNSVKSDDIITVLANQSPRNVIRFCDKIISEETLLRTDSTKISNKALELASIKYSEILAIEIYGNDSIKELKKLDCEIFTINYLAANIYKISQNSVRPRVGSWVTKGICYNVGTEVSKKIQRPTGVYYVFDPRLNQIINSKQSVFDFFKNKWFTCPHCDADILVNIEYINKLNSFECFKCNKSIS